MTAPRQHKLIGYTNKKGVGTRYLYIKNKILTSR